MNDELKLQLEAEKQIIKQQARTAWQKIRVQFWTWVLDLGQRRLERLKEKLSQTG